MRRRSLALRRSCRRRKGSSVWAVDALEEPLVADDEVGDVHLEPCPEANLAVAEALVEVFPRREPGVALPERLDRELGEANPGGGELGAPSHHEPEPPDGGGVGGGCQPEVDVQRPAAALDLPLPVEPPARGFAPEAEGAVPVGVTDRGLRRDRGPGCLLY